MYKIFERIKDFICIFDNNRIITFCNQSFLTHLNYSTLIGVSLDRILLSNDTWVEKKSTTTGKHLLTFKGGDDKKVIVYSEDSLPISYKNDSTVLITYPYEDIFYTKGDLERILDQLPFDIWLKNKSAQYLFVNQKHMDWLNPQASRLEFLGQEESLYWDEFLSQYFKRLDDEVFSTGRSIVIPEVITVNNSNSYWNTYKMPFLYNNDPLGAVLGTTYIPADNNKLEVALAHANRQLNLLYQVTQCASPHLSIHNILTNVSTMITQYLNAPALCIFSYDQVTSSFVACTSSGLFEQALPIQTRVPITDQLLAEILALSENAVLIDLTNRANLHPCYNEFIELFESLNLSYLNHYLIKDEKELLGLISLGYTAATPNSCIDTCFVETICNQVYALIKNSFLLDQAQAEIEKRKLAEQQTIELEKAMAVESMKNEFFLNISHELKTPINILLSTYSLLDYFYTHEMISATEDIDFQKYMRVMKQNAYRLLRLITNLIDMTKIESGEYPLQLGLYNIVHIIEETTLSITSYIESKQIELLFDTDIEECFILCDPEKVERIMFNLLSNAVKYVPDHGQITVYITHTSTHIRISVKDTGIGIPPDKLSFIFQRFSQVNTTLARPAEGSGIGLSLVHALIKMHHGHIWVESELEQGSEFIFELPIPTSDLLEGTHSQLPLNHSMSSLTQNSIERCAVEFSDIYY